MQVTLRWRTGRITTIEVDRDEVILDAAEAAGLGLPFGCRTGACATCTARVLEGEVRHVRPPRALKARHLDDDYVLTCIAVPETECTLEVGVAVQGDLVENPWK